MADISEFKRQLLEEFGVNEKGVKPITHDVEFKGKKWTLRRMKFDDLELINAILAAEKKKAADKVKKGAEEEDPAYMIDLKVQMVFVSVFLAAINDIPTWKAWETATEAELEGFHPLDPPLTVKKKTAEALYSFFKESRKLGVILHLFKTFNDVFEEPTESTSAPQVEEGEAPVTGDESDRPTRKP
jgi:hypothetical protein